MHTDILIVGQGLAGTLLAWEFERAGISFRIIDSGHEAAASRIAAGIINPITGRRLVKSWRVEEFLPMARESYRSMESALSMPLWREMRVRRLFADDRERKVFAQKQARGELAPYAGPGDADGFWIEQAAQVDTAALLAATRARWKAAGVLREERVDVTAAFDQNDLVIDCTGLVGAAGRNLPWEFSKGEILTIQVEGLDPDVVWNRGHWILPIAPGIAKVGATHEPGVTSSQPTAAARAALEASAREILSHPFTVHGHDAGVRVNLPDRRPVAGRHPANPRLGLFNGLGAKGALWAPMLARQWVSHLTEGVPFDPEVDAARFIFRNSSQALPT